MNIIMFCNTSNTIKMSTLSIEHITDFCIVNSCINNTSTYIHNCFCYCDQNKRILCGLNCNKKFAFNFNMKLFDTIDVINSELSTNFSCCMPTTINLQNNSRLCIKSLHVKCQMSTLKNIFVNISNSSLKIYQGEYKNITLVSNEKSTVILNSVSCDKLIIIGQVKLDIYGNFNGSIIKYHSFSTRMTDISFSFL